ncbi:MAG: glycogen synthase, partial [Bacillota bacterium]
KNYESDLDKKRENKVELQKMLGLTVNKDTPVLVLISRLVEEKGIGLLINILEELLELDLQLIILGTGEYEYEQLFKEVSWRYQNRVSAHITFNEDLARKLYAGGDFLLMPSQYEPCGTGQLIALRYYTLPVVRETGGLQDTVQGYNEKTEIGNGFTFRNYDSRELLDCIKYGLKCYHDSSIFKKIQNNVKKYDYSWKKSAGKYIDLYKSLI